MSHGIGKGNKFRGGLDVATKRWVMSRHRNKIVKQNKLEAEILILEKQLKQHPLGTIILKAKIKQKQIEIQNLDVKKIGRGKDRKKRFVIRREDKIAL